MREHHSQLARFTLFNGYVSRPRPKSWWLPLDYCFVFGKGEQSGPGVITDIAEFATVHFLNFHRPAVTTVGWFALRDLPADLITEELRSIRRSARRLREQIELDYRNSRR